MATEAQILANRRNTLRSSGPTTSAGRARSAMNACKSGIYAKSEIIPGEDPAELEALKTRIYDSLQPSPEEAPLVDQLIGADWQFRRFRRAEADLWKESITGDMESNRKKGLPEHQYVHLCAIRDNKDTFERIYRFQASTARILDRSLETLLRLRKCGTFQPTEQNEANSPVVEIAETNPIPEPVEPAASVEAGQPLSPANPEPQGTAETNPIPEVPVPTPQSLVPAEGASPQPPVPSPEETDETNPILQPAPAPGSRPLAAAPPAPRRIPVFHYQHPPLRKP